MLALIAVVLLILAFICLALAAIRVAGRRFDLMALGLAFWVASLLVGHVSIG